MQFLTDDFRERDVTAALVLFPLSHESGDEVQYEQMGLFTDPEMIGEKAGSWLVSGKLGTDKYSLLDLNNLPPGVTIRVTVETEFSKSETMFTGRQGSMPQPTDGPA